MDEKGFEASVSSLRTGRENAKIRRHNHLAICHAALNWQTWQTEFTCFLLHLLCFVNCRINRAEINPVFDSEWIPIAGFRQPTEGLGARQIQFSLDFEF